MRNVDFWEEHKERANRAGINLGVRGSHVCLCKIDIDIDFMQN